MRAPWLRGRDASLGKRERRRVYTCPVECPSAGQGSPGLNAGSERMRAVVVGLGKSGTTALVCAIRSAMPADTQLVFEPKRYVAIEAPNVAAKVLLDPKFPLDPAFYRQFDKIILI